MAAIATFALKPGVWFRRVRLVIVSPDSQRTACLLSGRNSTYRPVQISGTGSVDRALSTLELADFNKRFVNVPAKVQLQVRRVRRNGQIVRESFTLLKLEPADDPSVSGQWDPG